ncbi:MAG: hypothetical protein AB7E55_33250 [Pigmentiphaga sp.]
MNTLLFSLSNTVVQADVDLSSFDAEDAEYSCQYDIHEMRDGPIVLIDLRSFRRKAWRNMKPEWVKTGMLDTVVAKLEDQLQAQIERERYEDMELARESA